MRCEQCRTCNALDSNQYGLYCMISYPVPEIRDGVCSSYHPEQEDGRDPEPKAASKRKKASRKQ